MLQVAARGLDGEFKDQIRKQEVAMTGSSHIYMFVNICE